MPCRCSEVVLQSRRFYRLSCPLGLRRLADIGPMPSDDFVPNDLEASSRIGGSRTGPRRRGWVVCGNAKRSEKVDRATQPCAPTLSPPMAGLAAMTGMHRSD
jgi:hypothetical protein